MTESTILSALVQPDTSESNVKVGSIDEGFILTQYRFLLNVRAFMLQILVMYIHMSLADLSECASSPCQNGGTCIDQVNAFTCTCSIQYQGSLCQTCKYYNIISSKRSKLHVYVFLQTAC